MQGELSALHLLSLANYMDSDYFDYREPPLAVPVVPLHAFEDIEAALYTHSPRTYAFFI